MEQDRPLKLTKVVTPKLQPPLKGTLSRLEIHAGLASEFKEYNQWTDRCTELLTNNLVVLYRFDRMNYCMSRAYGNVFYRILINPIMAMCFHPSCLSKGSKPIRLKHILDITTYVQHLRTHSNDHIGVAMIKRFSALLDDYFITNVELDQLAKSPYQMNPNLKIHNAQSRNHLEKYGIFRDFKGV